jgi:hypothetical protein
MAVTSRSITRRSGGLPMLITAILVAEMDVHRSDLTKSALAQLTELAESSVDSSTFQDIEPAKWDLPQVHAQNTMRSIFIESKLSHASFGYVEDALVVAIKGFSSDMFPGFNSFPDGSFPIRNSSIMLFDSLLSRALGQKFARQDIDPSAPNKSVSSKVFFSKFPRFHQYLLNQLIHDVSLLEKSKVIAISRFDVNVLGYSRYWAISYSHTDLST